MSVAFGGGVQGRLRGLAWCRARSRPETALSSVSYRKIASYLRALFVKPAIPPQTRGSQACPLSYDEHTRIACPLVIASPQGKAFVRPMALPPDTT
jgi:hypothetical protein